MLPKVNRFARRYWLSRAAARYGARRRIPGLLFNQYGHTLGWRLLRRGWTPAVDYLLCPVSCVRYFEFDFALAWIPQTLKAGLDLSSPRLFSLYLAEHFPGSSVRMMNPDPVDLGQTREITERLRIANITLSPDRATALADTPGHFDAIWSISVVEHIAGDSSDTEAVRLLFQALKPGGVLILTVPVDRVFHEEYRDMDAYGTQTPRRGNQHFFQYVYDQPALFERLIAPLGTKPAQLRWFGERVPGHYREYEKRWLAEGRDYVIHDPREVADHYAEFRSWEEMPGFGICGLAIVK